MGTSKTIYLADDDADDRLLLIEAITSMESDIEIVEIENGQELLEIFSIRSNTE